jgi:hypothetical protein
MFQVFGGLQPTLGVKNGLQVGDYLVSEREGERARERTVQARVREIDSEGEGGEGGRKINNKPLGPF